MRLIVFIDNCAKISLHLLCKSSSSFLDISSIWFIRNFNSFNSFLSSFSSTSVSCFLFLKQNVAAILLLLSFYQYFVVIFCCSYNIFVTLLLLFVSLYHLATISLAACMISLPIWSDLIWVKHGRYPGCICQNSCLDLYDVWGYTRVLES